jgi:hypothetical protein
MFGDFPPSSSADALHSPRGPFVHLLTGRIRSGKRHFPDQRMLDQGRTDVGAKAGDDVHDAGRETGGFNQLHELERGR